MSSGLALDLRAELAGHLVSADQVHPRPGIATGIASLDSFLAWGGIPQGSMTLCYGPRGLGATSLWCQVAARVTQQEKWVAFVQSRGFRLCPWVLRRLGTNFSRLLMISAPADTRQLSWVLQELLESQLFELIGVDVDQNPLPVTLRRQVLRRTRAQKVAMFFLSSVSSWRSDPDFPLMLQFSQRGLTLTRAWQRPTPHQISRKEIYAHLMPELGPTGQVVLGGDLPRLQPSRSLP